MYDIKIKPIQWYNNCRATTPFGIYYIVDLGNESTDENSRFELSLNAREIATYPNVELAQAAAENDMRNQILSLIDIYPRHNDIDNLIEATVWAKNRLEMIADESWHGDARDFKRSLVGIFTEFDAALSNIKPSV